MRELRQSWKTGIALVSGIVIGITAAVVLPWTHGHGVTAIKTPVGSLAATTMRAVALDVSDDVGNLPEHARDAKTTRARSATDWERVAARYSEPGGDISLARSFMLRLDKNALRKLALNAATWPRSRRNQRVMGEIFHRWGELDPAAAIAAAQGLPMDVGSEAIREAVDGYAEADPAAAVAYLAAPPAAGDGDVLRNAFTRKGRLSQALEFWSEQDAAAAVNFATHLPPESFQGYSLDAMAQEWTRQDPPAALAWAAGLGNRRQRSSALDGVVTTWAETDPQAAANYVLGLSSGPDQDEFVKTVAAIWTTHDQSAAAQWATQQSGDLQAKAAAVVAETWSDDNPAAAAAWADQFPSGETRNAVWGAIGGEWYINDPAAALAWFNDLPTGDGRDAAIVGSTRYWVLRDQPAEMIGLVESIGSASLRHDTLVGVLNTWINRDSTAARAWVEQANLAPAITSRLNGH